MSVEQLATNFGLPGFLILIWYLLERARMARTAKVEEDKLVTENKKIDAMTVGFQSLIGKFDEHTRADLTHHGHVRDAIVALDSKVDTLIDLGDRFTPPPQEIPRSPRARTNPEGVPVSGPYSIRKPRGE